MAVGAGLLLLARRPGRKRREPPRRAREPSGRPSPSSSRFRRTAPLCQAREIVPEGAGVVRLRIGTYGRPGPPLALTVRSDAERPVVAQVRSGLARGRPRDRASPPASARARGRHAVPAQRGPRRITHRGCEQRSGVEPRGCAAKPQPGRIRVSTCRADSESWWAFSAGRSADVGSRAARHGAAGRRRLPCCAAVGAFVFCAGRVRAVVRAGRRSSRRAAGGRCRGRAADHAQRARLGPDRPAVARARTRSRTPTTRSTSARPANCRQYDRVPRWYADDRGARARCRRTSTPSSAEPATPVRGHRRTTPRDLRGRRGADRSIASATATPPPPRTTRRCTTSPRRASTASRTASTFPAGWRSCDRALGAAWPG